MKTASEQETERYAGMLAAIGTAPRLRIMRLLLAAHPDGLVVGDIQAELGIPGPTLSHHLEKLKIESLITVRREHQFLWYAANTEALEKLLAFLYQECCTRSGAVKGDRITNTCR